MAEACLIVAKTLDYLKDMVKPGHYNKGNRTLCRRLYKVEQCDIGI